MSGPLVAARAPGRVNLIGEHTDYNDGFVLPMAIDRSVYVAGTRRPGSRVRLHSLDYGEMVEFDVDGLTPDPDHRWSDYFKGMLAVLGEGSFPGGFDAVILGDVPQGAGLSSSAALEVSAGVFISAAFGFDRGRVDLARKAQLAENRFVGVNCGIMDQFASSLGRMGHALFIDCRTLQFDPVPLPSPGWVVAVADTGVRRGLVDSEYNNRRRECEAAVELLRPVAPGIKALRDVGHGLLEAHAARLPPVVRRRAAHVVGENERVQKAVGALRELDVEAFGRMMDDSHASLRDLYEVSCRALDAMVEAARDLPGVVGSRMTGAGFGGCTVSLVREEAAAQFSRRVVERYEKLAAGVPHSPPEVFLFQAEQGAELMGD